MVQLLRVLGRSDPERDVSAPVFPPVDDVLPQTGRMVLLTRILAHAEKRTTCAVEISSASPFLDGQGGVPARVRPEYMAQCIAAHGGPPGRAAAPPAPPPLRLRP